MTSKGTDRRFEEHSHGIQKVYYFLEYALNVLLLKPLNVFCWLYFAVFLEAGCDVTALLSTAWPAELTAWRSGLMKGLK